MEALVKFLSSIPATAWSALASAILTSIIAFLGISYSNKENLKRMKSQHEHERQLRKDEILRERAEELYVVVKKFCNTMISDHFPYVRVMKGHFSYNDALDMTIKSGEKQSYDPNRMHMIADIYFPELSEHIKSLVSLNGEALSFRDKYKHKYNSGMHKDEKTAAEYLAEIDRLIAAAKALEAEVASAVKRV